MQRESRSRSSRLASTRRQKSEGRWQMAEGYKEHKVAAFKELVNWLVFEAALH